jgi:hypothetical protein
MLGLLASGERFLPFCATCQPADFLGRRLEVFWGQSWRQSVGNVAHQEITVPKATRSIVALAVVLGVSGFACKNTTFHVDPSAAFFPLKPNMLWMYQVDSKSQLAKYTVTDMVIGQRYVPALKLSGAVVEEFYNFDRAGLRPIVYTHDGSYLTRLSGLDYVKNEIRTPPWGRSIDQNFLPLRLGPDQAWNNDLFPYGKLPGAFKVIQKHRTFVETSEVVVPAGHYRGCIRIETLAEYQGGAYAQQHQLLKLAYRDWYAPNVGLVRTIAYQNDLDGPEMERVELIRFNSANQRTVERSSSHQKAS